MRTLHELTSWLMQAFIIEEYEKKISYIKFEGHLLKKNSLEEFSLKFSLKSVLPPVMTTQFELITSLPQLNQTQQ